MKMEDLTGVVHVLDRDRHLVPGSVVVLTVSGTKKMPARMRFEMLALVAERLKGLLPDGVKPFVVEDNLRVSTLPGLRRGDTVVVSYDAEGLGAEQEERFVETLRKRLETGLPEGVHVVVVDRRATVEVQKNGEAVRLDEGPGLNPGNSEELLGVRVSQPPCKVGDVVFVLSSSMTLMSPKDFTPHKLMLVNLGRGASGEPQLRIVPVAVERMQDLWAAGDLHIELFKTLPLVVERNVLEMYGRSLKSLEDKGEPDEVLRDLLGKAKLVEKMEPADILEAVGADAVTGPGVLACVREIDQAGRLVLGVTERQPEARE